jgi:SAM-dependent methyltransferase
MSHESDAVGRARPYQPAGSFVGTRFTHSGEETSRVSAAVLKYLPPNVRARILEIGCGTGNVALAIARSHPQVEILGVDISSVNVEIARRSAIKEELDGRVRFAEAAYPIRFDSPFDLIFASSTLYLIRQEARYLADCLAHDLVVGGFLISIMPCDVPLNRAMILLRRFIRRFWSPPLERLAFAIAKLVHGDWDDAQLRDRIPYLYIIPEHLDSNALRDCFGAAGLELVAAHSWPRTSLAKLQHTITVYRRCAQT